MLKGCLVPVFLVSLFFSYSATAQQQPPAIIWQKCLGGSKDDKAYSIARAHDGGFIIAGSSKSNDGDVTGHHGSTDSTDGWVVKLDTAGNIQWQKSLGGRLNDEIDRIIPTSDGGYIGLGITESNDGDVSGNHGATDIWVVKLDGSGTIQWQRCLGGTNDDGLSFSPQSRGNIRQTMDNGYVIIGSTRSYDGDVTGNTSNAFGAAWIVKLDQSGAKQWTRCYNSSYTSQGYDILPLSSGNYLIAAEAMDASGDFALAGATANPPNAYLLKVDSNRNPTSAQWMGQRNNCYALKKINEAEFMLVNVLQNCYPMNPNEGFNVSKYDTAIKPFNVGGGSYSFCAPNNPTYGSQGVHLKGENGLSLLSDGTGVLCAASYIFPNTTGYHGGDNDGLAGTFSPQTWFKYFGGAGDDGFNEMVAQNDYTYYMIGYTNSNDGDVSGNHGGYDCWIVKMGNTNIIKGSVFLDYNLNGVRDANEPLVNSILVQSSQGGTTFSSSTYNGVYRNAVDTGVYTTTVLSAVPYYTAVPISATSTFHSYNNTDSISFALQPVPGKRDYQVNLFSMSAFPRPGQSVAYKLIYANVGTDTLVNKQVRVIKDPRATFVSASVAPLLISGDTLIWNISSMAPRDTSSIILNMQLAAPPLLKIGDTLLFTAYIDSTGDLHTIDNTSVLRQIGIGSFDPNDKEEVNGGVVRADDLGKGKALLYTIRFQNTGTDTAFRVIVRDTLGSKVDPATLEMVGASHPYQLNIRQGNILEWRFENILLPDSTQDQTASHGYVTYRIKAAAGVAVGDTIRNGASIYFDLNEPVATNTQLTVVTKSVLLPPPVPAISGLKTDYCPMEGAQKVRITNIPAPSYQATVTVKIDGSVTAVASDSSFSLRPDTLAPGQHTIVVVFSNAAESDTSSWIFRVDAEVTPVVSLGSNITTVTSLSQSVVLTAANTAGGGTQPKYTFAKDRGFTSLLQAESSLASVSVDPSTLQVGNNSCYVRMKTSDSCYTMQMAVDSIVIVRSPVTGIVDVDYPDQVINIYSNPFVDHLHITGLQSFKNYTFTLVRSNGQVVLRQQVSGQQEVNIETGVLASGVYLLNIYDSKKGRLIGAAKLLSLGK